MDFLTPFVTQARDLFRSMTPGARVTTGLLLAVLAVSVAYLFQSQTSGPDAFLMGGEPFSASQLPAMEAAFSKANLTDYEVEGNRIRVPRGQQASYMGALADAGALPANFGSYLAKALDDDDVFASNQQRATRLNIAKQNELALILRSMQGIENASVLYDVKKGTGLERGKDTISATVSIKPLGSQPLDGARVPMIRHLVAGAIAGLEPSSVTVADLNGRHYPAGTDANGPTTDPLEDPYYARKRHYEGELKEKIVQALRFIPGADVQVTAMLSRELRNVTKATTFDAKSVAGITESQTQTNKSENTPPQGRPGPEANGPGGGPTTLSSFKANTTSEETTNEKGIFHVPTTVTEKEEIGLIPQRVKVSVGIPSSYYVQVWQERNKPAEGEEPKAPDAKSLADLEVETENKIQHAIAPLLPPVPAGDDPFPHVAVTSYDSLSVEPIPEPGFAEQLFGWLGQYWTTMGMLGLALFSLLTLRSILKTPSPASAGAERAGSGLSLLSDEEEEDEEEEEAQRLKRRITQTRNLKDDLAELVQEDPDAAANILRNWISAAG
ncbi:MAG: hypothetical protein KDA42_02635 [Planctomycetales bacterium]|nr:hypothetical protein [Planctomycetales bacterium]